MSNLHTFQIINSEFTFESVLRKKKKIAFDWKSKELEFEKSNSIKIFCYFYAHCFCITDAPIKA